MTTKSVRFAENTYDMNDLYSGEIMITDVSLKKDNILFTIPSRITMQEQIQEMQLLHEEWNDNKLSLLDPIIDNEANRVYLLEIEAEAKNIFFKYNGYNEDDEEMNNDEEMDNDEEMNEDEKMNDDEDINYDEYMNDDAKEVTENYFLSFFNNSNSEYKIIYKT